MPRVDKPHWGKDGYESKPAPVEISREAASALFQMFEADWKQESTEGLRIAVIEIGNTYRRWKDRGPQAFTRAEARKALEELLRLDHIDWAVVSRLNERALQCLNDALIELYPELTVEEDDSVIEALVENRFTETGLRRATEDVVAKLKATKGQDRKGEIAWAVGELCCLYEQVTGRDVTHSNKRKDLSYDQDPQSEVGEFVRQCFKAMSEKVDGAELSLGMRSFIKNRDNPDSKTDGTHSSEHEPD